MHVNLFLYSTISDSMSSKNVSTVIDTAQENKRRHSELKYALWRYKLGGLS